MITFNYDAGEDSARGRRVIPFYLEEPEWDFHDLFYGPAGQENQRERTATFGLFNEIMEIKQHSDAFHEECIKKQEEKKKRRLLKEPFEFIDI